MWPPWQVYSILCQQSWKVDRVQKWGEDLADAAIPFPGLISSLPTLFHLSPHPSHPRWSYFGWQASDVHWQAEQVAHGFMQQPAHSDMPTQPVLWYAAARFATARKHTELLECLFWQCYADIVWSAQGILVPEQLLPMLHSLAQKPVSCQFCHSSSCCGKREQSGSVEKRVGARASPKH